MVKIDFAEVMKAGKSMKPVSLTLFANWAIAPFTMYGIALFFLGFLFKDFIGAHAYDFVKLPLGADWDIGSRHGAGIVVLHHMAVRCSLSPYGGVTSPVVSFWESPPAPLWCSFGVILQKGNDGHTLVMVAINSLTMLVLYGPLGGFLLGVGRIPVPWEALVLSIAIYVALPLVAGIFFKEMDNTIERQAVV